MRRILLLTLCAGAACPALAQQTEFSLHLTSGFAAFRGKSATDQTAILVPDNEAVPPYKYLYTTMTVPYTENPYGRKLGLSYGAAVQVQRVTAGQLVIGVQSGYEVLRSRAAVPVVFDKHDFGLSTKGHVTLANQFLNLHPFLGYRLTCRQRNFDLTAGPEVGGLLRSHETAKATLASPDKQLYSTNLSHSQRRIDVRARVNLTAYYNRWGLSLGYSRGLSKYQPNYADGINQLYSQVFRMGVAYRISGI